MVVWLFVWYGCVSREMEKETTRILLERQKEQIFADFRAEIQSSLSEEKLIMLLQEMNNFDEINCFFMNNYQNKIANLREAHIKSLHEMEELKRVQELRIDEF